MSDMENRGRAFENKFAQDEASRFKAIARRNKLLGLWVAEQLGVTGDEADEYANSVVRSDFEEPGDEDVFRKIKSDLDHASCDITEDKIRSVMQMFMDEATAQIKS